MLFIGANIGLEYDIAEAQFELEKNKNNAKTKIMELKNELEFVAEQISISEMSKARIISFVTVNDKNRK